MSQDYEHQPQGTEYTGQLDQWQPVAGEQGDATGGVIPYKNGPALAAYYLGIFSLIPCGGLLLAIPALYGLALSGEARLRLARDVSA